MTHPTAPSTTHHERAPIRAALVIAVVIAGFVGAAAMLVATVDPDRRHVAVDVAEGVPPLDLSTLPEAISVHYRAAEAHPETYREVPCFCGCEEFLGHRHLYDCFVRADGRGWDAHASGCGICIAESVTARDLLAQGRSSAAIRDAIVAQYGTTSPTTVRS